MNMQCLISYKQRRGMPAGWGAGILRRGVEGASYGFTLLALSGRGCLRDQVGLLPAGSEGEVDAEVH